MLALALPAQASATPAEIAFVGGGGIISARADGSAPSLLVADGSEPAWSPDGSRLAYVHARGEESAHLRLLDATGQHDVTPLRQNVAESSPTWSPDGSALVFTRFTASGDRLRSEIITRVLATGAENVVVRQEIGLRLASVSEPSWSPDGATIAYTYSRVNRELDFVPEIRTIPAAGGQSRRLIAEAKLPAWSPDGRRIAFAGVRDRNGQRCGSHECDFAGELYVAAADGTGLMRLTRDEGDMTAPKWSPDGSRILFSSDRNLPEEDSFEVYSVAPDGSCLTWLTNGAGSALGSWRPGSGDSFAPGSCDPNARPHVLQTPAPKPLADGLWLGPRYRGLILSETARFDIGRYAAYRDCERFDPRQCPPTIDLVMQSSCTGTRAFRVFTDNAFRYYRRRGALVAYGSPSGATFVLTGRAIVSIRLSTGTPYAAAMRVVRDLLPLGSTRPVRRLPAPRISRRLARLLDETARAKARYGSDEATARALRTEDWQVRGRLRVRAALRGYDLCGPA